MKTQHTPGPWRVNKVYQSGLIDKARMLIGTDSPASLTVAEAFWDIPAAEANAVLIASAPALLAENARLRSALDGILRIESRGVPEGALEACQILARAALKGFAR